MTHRSSSSSSSPSDFGCDAALAGIQGWLDGTPTVEVERLEAHARHCPDCRSLLAGARVLLDGVKRCPRPELPEEFTSIACRVVLQDRARRIVRRRWLAAGSLVALAASVILAVIVLRPGSEAPREWLDGNGNEVVRTTLAPGASEAPPPLKDRLAEAGDAMVALTRQTADETLGRTMSLLPRPELPKTSFATDRLAPALERLDEVRTGAALSLVPLANTARQAFDLFRRELAPADGTSKPQM